jgi:hypothetical protein
MAANDTVNPNHPRPIPGITTERKPISAATALPGAVTPDRFWPIPAPIAASSAAVV